MNSCDLVTKTIKGENCGITPVYGWIGGNPEISSQISLKYGSVSNFEDHYNFDMAHIFGGPDCFDWVKINEIKNSGVEITPEVLLDIPLLSPNDMEKYKNVIESLKHHKKRNRFCYVQSNGIFECLNSPFGIENHLLYLAMYPDELGLIYKRQAQWNIQVANNMIDLGMDMIHISDDWGAQNSLMFSQGMFKEMIYPYHKEMAEAIKSRDVFLSLHSDGNINSVLERVVDIGYDVVHPWQETAGMSYSNYVQNYSNKFAILGGLCIQSTLGFNKIAHLESEIRRVFNTLKGKRWIFCTTHFVQDHCSLEELVFAYDLVSKLAR